MKFDILTLFPEMFEPVKQSIIGKAIEKNLVEINLINIRDFSLDKHKKVDDTPYGGGAGMVMMPDVVYRAYLSIKDRENAKVIYLSPKGKTLNQKKVENLSKEEHVILLCGHYEGIDARIYPQVDLEVSLGNFILTGGELAACTMIDAITRLQKGTFKKQDVTTKESFEDGLLEAPQYTRPEVWRGKRVPAVLLNGNHKEIEAWKQRELK